MQYNSNTVETNSLLRKTQKCELEIMKDIHIFCVNNNIKYSLCYGTALGAVRHKGFIPWDDDIDIVMPREDYDRFISLWQNNDKYHLVNKDTDIDFTQNFTKIKKNNTVFLQPEDIKKNYHKGIFIDIFPADRIPSNKILRSAFLCNCLINLLYTRNHNSKSNLLIRTVESILLNIFSENRKIKILRKSNVYLKKYNCNQELDYIFLGDLRSCSIQYPNNMFDRLSLTKFEDSYFYIFDDVKLHLTKVYGNYMQLPPKEKQRWTHSPIEVHFGDNEEI